MGIVGKKIGESKDWQKAGKCSEYLFLKPYNF
jgi:hypothetical protein